MLDVSVSGGFMRVTCRECGSKSTIRKTNKISSDYSELYCGCNDPECGHTFVVSLGFRNRYKITDAKLFPKNLK